MDAEILKTLLKKATGYSHDEVQEEYSVRDDGEIALTKRKVIKKYYPPDSAALKAYLELAEGRSAADYSDEELTAEKARLLRELKKTEGKRNADKTQKGGRVSDKEK